MLRTVKDGVALLDVRKLMLAKVASGVAIGADCEKSIAIGANCIGLLVVL